MSKPTERVRVAVVGAGSMANRVHYPSLADEPNADVVAICDLDEERLTSTADRYGIDQRFHDYRQMVAAVAPDAVYVIGQPAWVQGVNATPDRVGCCGWVMVVGVR